MHAPFEIHWSRVPPSESRIPVARGQYLLAMWPAPVNYDECFKAAGFSNFADNDDEWDARAEDFLTRVLTELLVYGSGVLQSAPLTKGLPWYRRPFQVAPTHTLINQILLPMHWDSLPACHVSFGGNMAALRTGDGHFLLWLTLPAQGQFQLKSFLSKVAGPWPVLETHLNWRALQGAA